jgi:DNA-3-methyladenine glycosylase II
MATHTTMLEVLGPWSLDTSKAFWEGFAPAALAPADVGAQAGSGTLDTVFVGEADWQRVAARVTQHGDTATLTLAGPGDLDAAAIQVGRFLSLDVDATGWPEVGARDPVIADAQRQLPGFRPCGFHSPYEAAAWAVLSQRVQIRQAAKMRHDLVARHGDDGAFPTPRTLRGLSLGLPGRKDEYLHAVAEAALDGLLDGAALRALPAAEALARVQSVKGLGPFAAEHVVIRGCNAPDILPTTEGRLLAELVELYGADRTVDDIADAWRPYRSWASVYLRSLREHRTHEIERGTRRPR